MQTDGDEDVLGADRGGQDQACHEKGVVADCRDQCWGRRTGPDSYQKGDDYILSLISGLKALVEIPPRVRIYRNHSQIQTAGEGAKDVQKNQETVL